MNKKLNEAHGRFVYHFHYSPEFPPRIDFDQDEYADLLDKCVADNFDYTIEKYGTKPPKSFEPSDFFID